MDKVCPSCHEEFTWPIEHCDECGVVLTAVEDVLLDDEPITVPVTGKPVFRGTPKSCVRVLKMLEKANFMCWVEGAVSLDAINAAVRHLVFVPLEDVKVVRENLLQPSHA